MSGTSLQLDTQLPVIPFPAPSAIGEIRYYSNHNTAMNVHDGPGPNPPIPGSILQFTDANGPVYVAYNSPTFQTCFPTGSTFATRDAHYLGVDSSGTLCWRVENGFELGNYVGWISMPELSEIGQSATVSCFATPDPPPDDGVSCPVFTFEPTDTTTMFLVAN